LRIIYNVALIYGTGTTANAATHEVTFLPRYWTEIFE